MTSGILDGSTARRLTGGTVTDPDITGDDETVDEGNTVDANCFGEVIQHEAPRQGIGNQDLGHPAAYGAFYAQFEEEDAEDVEENCYMKRRGLSYAGTHLFSKCKYTK